MKNSDIFDIQSHLYIYNFLVNLFHLYTEFSNNLAYIILLLDLVHSYRDIHIILYLLLVSLCMKQVVSLVDISNIYQYRSRHNQDYIGKIRELVLAQKKRKISNHNRKYISHLSICTLFYSNKD